MIRLDKYCSSLGIGSRQDIDQYCRKWLIYVNDQIIKRSDIKIHRWDHIYIKDNNTHKAMEIECKEYITLILHKPKWYVCSDMDDGWHPSYRALLNDCPYRNTLHVAGRLDQDTTWLVICTNNGDLNHRIISPKHKLVKTYIVHCEKEVTDDMISQLEQWVVLDDGYITLPATVEKSTQSTIITVCIREGKYHQVKRMLESVGNKVIALHRSSIGNRNIDTLEEWKRHYLNPDI